MDLKKFSIKVLLLIFVIFLLNYFAMKFHWYSSVWYFDMVMHFLGGFWVSLASVYFLSIKNRNRHLGWYILRVFFIVLLIGVGWEVFEILIDKNITGNYLNILDTFSDISFDISGGFFALFYFFRKIFFIEVNKL